MRSATYHENAGLQACSACAGDYEDPDRTAPPLDDDQSLSESGSRQNEDCRGGRVYEPRSRESEAEAEVGCGEAAAASFPWPEADGAGEEAGDAEERAGK